MLTYVLVLRIRCWFVESIKDIQILGYSKIIIEVTNIRVRITNIEEALFPQMSKKNNSFIQY
jgi:hypothetical protein